MGNEAEVNQAFEYAKAAGMTKIIGVPAPAMLPLVNDKVQQYDIPSASTITARVTTCTRRRTWPTSDIKTLDKRIGLCHDVGHTVRVGKDPAAISRTVRRPAAGCAHQGRDGRDGRKGNATPCGRGSHGLAANCCGRSSRSATRASSPSNTRSSPTIRCPAWPNQSAISVACWTRCRARLAIGDQRHGRLDWTRPLCLRLRVSVGHSLSSSTISRSVLSVAHVLAPLQIQRRLVFAEDLVKGLHQFFGR